MAKVWISNATGDRVGNGSRGFGAGDLRFKNDGWEARVQERDACFYCGVRADLGCKHRRSALQQVQESSDADARGRALAQALLAAKVAGGAR